MIEFLPAYPFYDGVQGTTLAVAHGADTPAALQRANDLGYRYVETNVMATSDGVPVAFHGAKLWQPHSARLLREMVQSRTLEDVRRLALITEQPISPLEELVIDFPAMRFFLDLKTAQAVQPVARLINRLSLHDRVSVGGSNYRYTRAVEEAVRADGFVCTSIGTVGSLALLGTRSGLPLAEEYIAQSEATHFMLPFRPVQPDTTERAHSRDMGVLVWTPNREKHIVGALARGVDGIMSDEFELLQKLTEQPDSNTGH